MTLLSRLLVVTDRGQAGDLVAVLAAAVDAGARAVLLREKDLPAVERHALADRITALGTQVIVGSDDEWEGDEVVHLSAKAPTPSHGIFGRSCHSIDDLRAAKDEGAAYATLSPIWETASKPGYGPALGIEGLAAVPGLPVYAFGGVTPGRAAACLEAGAAGVAVMGAVMGAPDPAAVVRVLLGELGETGRR